LEQSSCGEIEENYEELQSRITTVVVEIRAERLECKPRALPFD
jgi:hypothetical protein